MPKRSIFLDFLTTVAGVLFGNWLGGQLRFLLTRKPVQSIHFKHTAESGLSVDNYPVTTKFWPGLMFAFLGRPRWLFALMGGLLAGLLVDDRYEELWLERVLLPLVQRFPGVEPKEKIDIELEA